MKKLIFVRHGRAEEPASAFPDFERSLTTKGKTISEQMASLLLEKEKKPGLFISSPAFRAYETALIFARVFDFSPDKIVMKSNLYYKSGLSSFAEIIESVDNKIDSIILFGHNPSFTEVPDKLSRDGCDFLPKSGIVCISFKSDTWKGIVHDKGKLEYFLKPEKHD
jgi:phosphohistidine phosphatase